MEKSLLTQALPDDVLVPGHDALVREVQPPQVVVRVHVHAGVVQNQGGPECVKQRRQVGLKKREKLIWQSIFFSQILFCVRFSLCFKFV